MVKSMQREKREYQKMYGFGMTVNVENEEKRDQIPEKESLNHSVFL